MIHANTLEAYFSTGANRSNLETRILGLMADGAARTDREIQHALNYPEAIRPRVTTLISEGLLHEVGSKVCETTGKKVRLTKRFI